MKTVTIKKVLSNIKLALDYALKKEIIDMNPAAIHILGYSHKNELIGAQTMDLYSQQH